MKASVRLPIAREVLLSIRIDDLGRLRSHNRVDKSDRDGDPKQHEKASRHPDRQCFRVRAVHGRNVLRRSA
jgi:hypothetical protein